MASIHSLTVILPAHNAEETIAQAIASTLNQTYTDFELWVLENGSSDQTAEIARSFSDPRVKVFELGPVGFQGALQYAIENAPSEWLARMDADDLMFPERLRIQMKVVQQRPELVFVGTACALLTPFNHIFERVMAAPSREVDSERLGWGRFFGDPSVVFNRRVALEAGGVDSEFSNGDVPLLFRLLQRGNGWEIADSLHLYRLGPHSMSRRADFLKQGIQIRAKYAPNTLSHYGTPPEVGSSAWGSIAALELLSGDSTAVRQAARFLEAEAPRTAKRMRWGSYFGRVAYVLYNWRYPSRYSYRRRRDWERLFAPFLERELVNFGEVKPSPAIA
jgi:glycosyltransferase involved in cell wall biosynthesis